MCEIARERINSLRKSELMEQTQTTKSQAFHDLSFESKSNPNNSFGKGFSIRVLGCLGEEREREFEGRVI